MQWYWTLLMRRSQLEKRECPNQAWIVSLIRNEEEKEWERGRERVPRLAWVWQNSRVFLYPFVTHQLRRRRWLWLFLHAKRPCVCTRSVRVFACVQACMRACAFARSRACERCARWWGGERIKIGMVRARRTHWDKNWNGACARTRLWKDKNWNGACASLARARASDGVFVGWRKYEEFCAIRVRARARMRARVRACVRAHERERKSTRSVINARYNIARAAYWMIMVKWEVVIGPD